MNRTKTKITFPDVRVDPVRLIPNFRANNAAAPETKANPTAKTWDKEETDPITNSGEGMAIAVCGKKMAAKAKKHKTGNLIDGEGISFRLLMHISMSLVILNCIRIGNIGYFDD
ncbi:hypothetical protein OAC63_01255 [Amylibacter sp.]|jgi:hypothetical protein|nr:hypothetical protein [Amylibacter sp.]